ncbi:helix-turn-helix transcriptional regulator [Streptomyces sp. ZAF1911]|uniref:PadR family transcriptional regulator n=1 Tax=unclassified Streptomyces TaxID=2593676 RepID=UPI0020304E17|nr:MULTISPECIES: helix-turn-helix transcriptional regulator [unclassified Streptomyces]MCM1971770.1 helix-turn-helix transcriptional regulator [Streptomyces sp. G1]MCX5126129.1 helix-turn-helix transcriptional regulator [Streptomyces sp. NBC_00347]MCX5299759.1 helix-turn-helix transcriptional regulator [Streptomyces sp. NBC_00193]MDD9376604.1 helix-turn-helix transcriptional regulator [Streptomyces sp. ZAF1911]
MKAETLRGNLEGMLLSVLEPGEQHGYAVIEELKRRSGDAINLPTGTVYPALHRLEAAGLVGSEWSTFNGRRRRNYFLTTAGRRALADKRTAWQEVSSVISVVLGGGA